MNCLRIFTQGISAAFTPILAILTLSSAGVVDANDIDPYAAHRQLSTTHSFGFQTVYHNSYQKHRQHSYQKHKKHAHKRPSYKNNYGKKYHAYKKHHKNHYANRHNKHYPNKYYSPPAYDKKQYHRNGSHGVSHKSSGSHLGTKYSNRPFKKDYWAAHKRHGYRYKRVNGQHYYYNTKGFYFPSHGLIEHGHKHHEGCEDWHFSPRVTASLLSSIYKQ